jgi:PAS domain S-box-containing protein
MSEAKVQSETVELIQVLHVEDESDFADLTATFLEREDDQFTVETATTADDGLERIDARRPDCVVSDYNMPGMNGLEYLQAVRERYPDLPFILFTGKGSEAVASDAISAGVTDYLRKQSGTEQYELLANRIRNAVDARREAKRADRQEQLMRLTEFAGDTGGFELDVDSGTLMLTDGARRLVGLPEDAHLNLEEAIELYHPDDQADVRQTLNQTVETGEQTRGTWRLQTLDDDERLVDVTMTPATEGDDVTTLRGAVHDITERKQRKRELRAERRFIEQALDTLDDLFYVLDTDGTLRRWNDRVPEVTDYTDRDLANMYAMELFTEDERETIAGAIETTLADGQATVEADLRTADGERRPYEFTGAQLTDEEGPVTGLVGVGRDLTERRQRERRLQALVEESNDIISIVDADGVFQYQSPSIEHILGYDPGETIGDPAWEYVHPDDRADLIEAFERGIENTDANPVMEYRTRHADGSWRWLEARGNNQLDNPAVEGYIVNSRDVTDRKERRQELEKYETIIEALTDAVYVLDEEGRFTFVSDELVELVGYDRETILGSTPSLIKDEDAVERAEHHLGRLLSSDGPETVQFEVTVQPCDGDPIVCEDHMSVLPYEGDEFAGSVGTLRDITEHKERARKLERQNTRLQEFVSVVSHDLRNPLNVALGHTELAQRECDSEHLDTVGDAVDRCQALVEDLLALARSGKSVGTMEPVSLSELAEECWQTTPSADASLAIETDQTISTDRSRLQQLFENLFRNAVNHGGVEVTVTVGEIADGFYVADDGAGIPDEERDNIFEAGYSTADDGTGFGLAIVKEIVEAHGWEIRVTDSESGGARFEITGVEVTD